MARLLAAACAVALLSNVVDGWQRTAPVLPARLEQYLAKTVRLTDTERRRLMAGGTVTRMLEATDPREIAVFGATWIAAPRERYVAGLLDIEAFERGSRIRITRRVSAPPQLDDFAEMRVPSGDFEALRTCRAGDCAVKLDARAVARFRTEIDRRQPNAHATADALLRTVVLQYIVDYLAGGNDRLPVYVDAEQPTPVGDEFRSMMNQAPELLEYAPALRRYLLDFPRAAPNGTSFIYWQEASFGLKPTIRVSHVTIREEADATLVASKLLYASHYFITGLETRALLPDPSRGTGFWFVMINRSRADGLTGFTGLFARPRVRRDVQAATLTALAHTKQRLEAN